MGRPVLRLTTSAHGSPLSSETTNSLRHSLPPSNPTHPAGPKPASHVVVVGGGKEWGCQPGCPPLRLSWPPLPTGAHTPACSHRSARNPKQLSWVGGREGPAVFGTQNSSLEPGCSQSHGTREGTARGLQSSPQPSREIKNVLCVFLGEESRISHSSFGILIVCFEPASHSCPSALSLREGDTCQECPGNDGSKQPGLCVMVTHWHFWARQTRSRLPPSALWPDAGCCVCGGGSVSGEPPGGVG